MNSAVKMYKKKWFKDSNSASTEPCLSELLDPCHLDLQTVRSTKTTTPANIHQELTDCPVLVTCEDFGQAIPLPSYKASRPNVDYFNSDLHVQMFNVSNMVSNTNHIYLYDERVTGKSANAVCSLRYNFHVNQIKYWLERGCEIKMLLKVMDNCCAQNKSNATFMFDALQSILLYERVCNFYLLPGHSHMRPDQVTALCKNSLKRKDLYVPDQIAECMSQVETMKPIVVTTEMSMMKDWESFLVKLFKPLPPGFTSYYCFEVAMGSVTYKRLCSDVDDRGLHHSFCENVQVTRQVILKELLDLPPTATLWDIVHAKVILNDVPPRQLAPSKIKSIRNKLDCIPKEFRHYYPALRALPNITPEDNDPPGDALLDPSDDVPQGPCMSMPRPVKRAVGRPKKVVQPTTNVSIVKFLIGSKTNTKPVASSSKKCSSSTVTATVTSASTFLDLTCEESSPSSKIPGTSKSALNTSKYSKEYMAVEDFDAYQMFDEMPESPCQAVDKAVDTFNNGCEGFDTIDMSDIVAVTPLSSSADKNNNNVWSKCPWPKFEGPMITIDERARAPGNTNKPPVDINNPPWDLSTTATIPDDQKACVVIKDPKPQPPIVISLLPKHPKAAVNTPVPSADCQPAVQVQLERAGLIINTVPIVTSPERPHFENPTSSCGDEIGRAHV
jgi:hypothetical protein